ncbi:TCPG protein, partial [Pedionomus torquatus]|nr:TCPG protein [Pedionomus torquatus]
LFSPFLVSCQIPGGFSEDSCVLRGIMVNKDVTHPRMRRLIKNPRIVLLDCSLEYKKGESQTDIEITREEDFARILQMEEEYIQQICEDLMRVKPDLVITEKGISGNNVQAFFVLNSLNHRMVRVGRDLRDHR